MAKPKLIWHSNAGWSPTGYGQQTALFAPRLNKVWDVGISSFYGLEGNILPWKGMPVYPGLGQSHGNQSIIPHAEVHLGGLRNGLVFTLLDVWVLDPAVWRQLNVASWVPVDHEPAPEPVKDFFRKSGSVPIAMSRFGEEQLQELDPLYVPHGVDCEVYKPQPKDEARKSMGMPKDAFLVGMVAANKGNPSRKCFHEALQAFKLFRDRHPDALLYLHTEASGMFDGVDLRYLVKAVGLDTESVFFQDQYRAVHYPYPPEAMARIYSAFDVLLSPSAGEGFGLSVLEAGACGVPAIVSDFSAQPEVIGAGWKVTGRKVYTPIKSWQFLPDIEDIVESLNASYSRSEAGRKELATKARAHAETYHIDRVMEDYMLPALEAVTQRFEERRPVNPIVRARQKHAHKVAA